MNWSRVFLAGAAGAAALFVANIVLHGILLGPTYLKYPAVFAQGEGGYLPFTGIMLAMGLTAAALFARTRTAWAAGWKGGAVFGFWLGLFLGTTAFVDSMIIDGWPYFLSWCHFGSDILSVTLAGSAMGLVLRSGEGG